MPPKQPAPRTISADFMMLFHILANKKSSHYPYNSRQHRLHDGLLISLEQWRIPFLKCQEFQKQKRKKSEFQRQRRDFLNDIGDGDVLSTKIIIALCLSIPTIVF